jgi:ribonuclease III
VAAAKPRDRQLVEAIEARTGHAFASQEDLERALTHASARGTQGGFDYQRLEFLGDRVLGIAVAELLFAAFPKATEGELSVRLNALVNAEILAEIAEEIGLPELIRAGSEIRTLSGKKRVNLRADTLEALIAAIYLDGGFEPVRRFIDRCWRPRAEAVGAMRRDPKTELQEWAHRVAGATPAYEIEGREGPDHDPVFTARVQVAGYEPASGSGRTKREAEQAAAAAVLLREKVSTAEGEGA